MLVNGIQRDRYGGRLTALRRSEVLARSRRARAGTTSLLDAQGAALNDLTLEALLGSIGHIRGNHLDETESAGLLAVGITHNLALLNLAVLLKEASNLLLRQLRMDAGDEKVGSGVDRVIIIAVLATLGCRASIFVRDQIISENR